MNLVFSSVPFGQAYEVTVLTHPTGQECVVKNGSGTTHAGPVNNVLVTCEDYHTLEEILVEGKSYSAPGVSTIDAESLEEAAHVNVADVLNDEPDISLSRRARIGDCSDSLSIRGFSGNRILLNINGRPINSAGVGGGYYIDWNAISLDNVEKVEIIRGGSSARYSNTLGGVVNVVTKTATSEPETTFFGNYGTGDISNMYTLRVTNSYKPGLIGYSIGANYQKADAFLWNNDFERKNANLNTTFDLPTDGDLSFGFR